MFGLFKSKPFQDSQLGELKRSGRYWKVAIPLAPHGDVEVRVSGSREQPDAESLAMARELTIRYGTLLPQIQTSLFEHYEPYGEAASTDDASEGEWSAPVISSAEGVWPHVSLGRVSIEPMEGVPTVEFAYSVAWDEEHTLGARFQDWKLIELCGSVL